METPRPRGWRRRLMAVPAAVVAPPVAGSPPDLMGAALGSTTTGGHQQADLLLLRGPCVEDRDEPAAVHDADAVRQLEDLVKLGRDEQDGRARVPLGDDLVVDELDRADVEPACRLVGDEQRQVALELARDDQLLLIAARQRARRDVGRRRPDVELGG